MSRKSQGGGRGLPPESFKWKKGQTGNPKKKRRRRSKSTWRMVEEIFQKEVAIIVVTEGEKRRGTIFEAICYQLIQQATAGSKRASKLLPKYQAFAKTKPEYYVVTPTTAEQAAAAYQREIRRMDPK